jgi:hypothetical protein
MKKPGIPSVTITDTATQQMVSALKENIELITGARPQVGELRPLAGRVDPTGLVNKVNEVINRLNFSGRDAPPIRDVEFSGVSGGANPIIPITPSATNVYTVDCSLGTYFSATVERIGVSGAPSTYPVVADTATFQQGTTTTTHNVTLPSSISAGNLLIMVFRAGDTVTATTPSGWTLLDSRSSSGVTYIWYKVATGSEGATETVTTASSIRSSAITYRITGYTGTPEALFASTNVNDPPEITTSWPATKNLFIAVLTNRRSDSTVTAAPTNYSNLLTIAPASNTGINRSRVSTATREVDGATEDPGAFTTSGTIDSPHSATIAVQGVPGTPTTFYEPEFVFTNAPTGAYEFTLNADYIDGTVTWPTSLNSPAPELFVGRNVLVFNTQNAGVDWYLFFTNLEIYRPNDVSVKVQTDTSGFASFQAKFGTQDSVFFSSGNGQHSIYGEGAIPLNFYTDGDSRFRIGADGQLSAVIPGGSTLYPSFTARAWVNFNGTGTVAIRASGNVSSITDNGVGTYTVNFTNAMPDANYGISLAAGAGGSGDAGFAYSYASPTSSGLQISVSDPFSLNLIDRPFVYAVIHR